MLTADALTRDNRLVAAAIHTAAAAPAADLLAAVAVAEGAHAAALWLAISIQGAAVPPELVRTAMTRDGLHGKAAALVAAQHRLDAAVAAAIPDGSLDVRENGYAALAAAAAAGRCERDAIVALVEGELQRALAGKTSLAEHALRILAIVGDERTLALAQRIIETDRFCDRFEVNRLRKAVSDGGRDDLTRKALLSAWTTQFADHLASDPVPAAAPQADAKPAPNSKAPVTSKAQPSSKAQPGSKAAPSAPSPTAPAPSGFSYDVPGAAPSGTPAMTMGTTSAAPPQQPGDGDDAQAPAEIVPIDWKAFALSDEAKALKPAERQMAMQIGPLLEELASRAIGAALGECSAQEITALLVQVLPQALPPQHVQMALSPQSLNGLHAVGAWLDRAGTSAAPGALVAAIKLVRQQMQAHLRRSGIIGGPDYSEPGAP